MANNQNRTNLNDAVSKTDARLSLSSRRCFVSRKRLPRKAMLRFVYDEEGRLCLDLAEKLPGRGTWLALDRDSLFIGIRRLLAREREPCRIEDFLQNSAKLLEQRCLLYLALSRRAGLAVHGASACLRCARESKLQALICAREASPDESRKILRVQRNDRGGEQKETDEIPRFACFDANNLGQVFAREQVVYAGLRRQGDGRASRETYGLVQRTFDELQRFVNFLVLFGNLQESNGVDQMITKHATSTGSDRGLPNGVVNNKKQFDEEINYVGR